MAKKKATSTDVNPRLVLPGHLVQPKSSEAPELVRSVSVVLHLANGFDEVYETDETVKVLPPEELPETLPDDLTPPPVPVED